jgi:hypothetical protein
MSQTSKAWAAFLISSALIIGTLLPVMNYGMLFLLFPVALLFGCDGARSGAGCVGMLLTPFVPLFLTFGALIFCRSAVRRSLYGSSVVVAAAACAASWLVFLSNSK